MSTQFNPVSQLANFGRAWSLTVTSVPDANGKVTQKTVNSLAWLPEPMRIVFEVNLPGYLTKHTFWTAKIELYNLSSDLNVSLSQYGQGAQVVLSAGYQMPGAGIIFAGTVYQVFYERPDVKESKITLMCYTGVAEAMGNFVNLRGQAQMTQAALMAKMAAGATVSIPIDPASQTTLAALPVTQYPRARAYFGDPHAYFNAVAQANKLTSWYGFNGYGICPLSNPGGTSTITYTSTNGILGTPQLTQYGVSFVVSLDPRLRVQTPRMIVNIAQSLVRQMPYSFPGYPAVLNPAGEYIVNGLQFRGDSRGNQWETEITGVQAQGGLAELIYQATSPSASQPPQLDPYSPVGGQ